MQYLLGLFLFWVSLFSLPAFAAGGCEVNVQQASYPLKAFMPLCIDDYFYSRDLGKQSQTVNFNNQPTTFRDPENMQFNDYLNFKTRSPRALGTDGRLELVKTVLAAHRANLRNEFGLCTLNVYAGEKLLTVEDYLHKVRDKEELPGDRLYVYSAEQAGPTRWDLICPNGVGGEMVDKTGVDYYIFVDVYENTEDKAATQGHYISFLFSFR
jgi:hypothetical protein